MGRDLRKLKDHAVRWYKKGKYGKALEAYSTIAQTEPDNPQWFIKVGETYRKLGQNDKAIIAFRGAAKHYSEHGFLLKAIAVCKLILEMDPTHQETQIMLARYHSKQRGDEAPVEEPAGKPKKHKTLPPGCALDAVKLHEVIPEARADDTNGMYEIPLDQDQARGASGIDLPATPLFSSLDASSLRSLVEKVSMRRFEAGARIITEGEEGSTLYIVVEGEVQIYCQRPNRVELGRLGEGAFFGEIALITHFTRTSTVEALQDTTVLEISTEVMGDLIEEHPSVLKVMLAFFRDRLIKTLVETSELFAPFTSQDRLSLAERFSFLEADAGTTLVCRGSQADGLYVLLCGQVEAEDRFGPGHVFGARAMLSAEGNPVSVVARTRCWLLRLDQAVFREVIMTHPQVLAYVSELADRRAEKPIPLH